MRDKGNSHKRKIGRFLRQCLEEGKSVEIDGLGVFRMTPDGTYGFDALQLPRIFLAYVREDLKSSQRLYDNLAAEGFDPWLDKRKLLPGQNWPRSIENAIDTSDFFVACFSRNSVKKKGDFQAEIRYALECARRQPLDDIFLIPVRLDDCKIPLRIQREIQYIDLFPDWGRGLRRIVSTIHTETRRRQAPISSGQKSSAFSGSARPLSSPARAQRTSRRQLSRP